MEMSLEELQKMLADGKISTEQFTSIMIDNFGQETVMKAMQDTFEQVYGSSLKKIFGEKDGLAKAD